MLLLLFDGQRSEITGYGTSAQKAPGREHPRCDVEHYSPIPEERPVLHRLVEIQLVWSRLRVANRMAPTSTLVVPAPQVESGRHVIPKPTSPG